MANMEKYSYKRPERVGTQLRRCGSSSSRGQYITVLHSTVQYSTVRYGIQYSTIYNFYMWQQQQLRTVQYNIIQYNI